MALNQQWSVPRRSIPCVLATLLHIVSIAASTHPYDPHTPGPPPWFEGWFFRAVAAAPAPGGSNATVGGATPGAHPLLSVTVVMGHVVPDPNTGALDPPAACFILLQPGGGIGGGGGAADAPPAPLLRTSYFSSLSDGAGKVAPLQPGGPAFVAETAGGGGGCRAEAIGDLFNVEGDLGGLKVRIESDLSRGAGGAGPSHGPILPWNGPGSSPESWMEPLIDRVAGLHWYVWSMASPVTITVSPATSAAAATAAAGAAQPPVQTKRSEGKSDVERRRQGPGRFHQVQAALQSSAAAAGSAARAVLKGLAASAGAAGRRFLGAAGPGGVRGAEEGGSPAGGPARCGPATSGCWQGRPPGDQTVSDGVSGVGGVGGGSSSGGVPAPLVLAGWAHAEKNWGEKFPEAYVWAQGVSPDGRTSFALAAGPVPALAGAPAAAFSLHTPRTDLSVDASDPGLPVRLSAEACRGALSLELRSPNRLMAIYIEAPRDGFVALPCPTATGFRVCTEQSHAAIARVRVYESLPFFGDRLIDSAVLELAALEFGGTYACGDGHGGDGGGRR